MRKPYIHLLGHLIAISDDLHHSVEKPSFLQKLWEKEEDSDVATVVDQLIKEAEKLFHHYHDTHHDDRTHEHEIHLAANMVEMWIQSVEMKLSKFYETAQLHNIIGATLHGPDHTLTVVAQGVRLIELIRTSPGLVKQLGGTQGARDIINQGWTSLSRLYATMKPLTNDGLTKLHYDKITEFFKTIDTVSEGATKEEITKLVYAGYVPHDQGLPVGGSAFFVTLHKYAQGSLPDLSTKMPTSGWSIGREGNKENIGGGRES